MADSIQSKTEVPTVSVIVPVWNDEDRLQLCLEALEAQTYPSDRYEVIVADNGSEPPVVPLVERYPHVRVTTEPEAGSYRARNTGLELATGEVIAFTDSDCVPANDWLVNGSTTLANTPDVGLVGGMIELVVQDENHPSPVELYERVFAFPQERYVRQEHWAATANVFTYRRILDSVGGFDGDLQSGGDMQWGRRVAAAGFTIAYAEDARVQHPARHSVKALVNKTTRTAGGGYAIARASGRHSLRVFIRSLARNLLPARSVLRVWRAPVLNGPVEALKASAIVLLIGYVRAWESIRLRLGGTPRR